MFRQGLRTLLNKTDGIEVIGEASDGHETLKQCEMLKPDIAVLDVAMPGLNGVEVSKRIRKKLPETRILILTMHADSFLTIEALKAGALGYLLKEDSFKQLVDAIRTVAKDEIFVSSQLDTSVMKGFVHLARHPQEQSASILTNREREVIQLVAEGMTNQGIADLLCISPNTVDTHRKNIMSKLNIHSVAGIVKYAIKNKIVTI